MKRYTPAQLQDFVYRADSNEKCNIAREFINSRPYLNPVEKEYFTALIEAHRVYVNTVSVWDEDDYDDGYDDDRNYSPSAPWNAPGMRVSDFI